MTNERTIKNLRGMFKGHIYIRFKTNNDYCDFLERIEQEGFLIGGLAPTKYKDKEQDMVSIIDNKQVSFCGAMSRIAFSSNAENVHRVDYNKYISGDEAYII